MWCSSGNGGAASGVRSSIWPIRHSRRWSRSAARNFSGIERGGWLALLAIALAALAYYITNVGVIAINIAAHTGPAVADRARFALVGADDDPDRPDRRLRRHGLHERLGLLGIMLFVLSAAGLAVHAGLCRAEESPGDRRSWRRRNGAIERAHAEKEQTLQQMIATVAAIIDARDQAVAGHSSRVAKYASALGEELGLAAARARRIDTAGLLHDLGKIAIPETILHKPAKLTAEEYTIVKEHAATGERILAQVQPLLAVARMVGDHHERFDGRGYPNGEAGATITQGGRILAVADMLDSILSDSPLFTG